MSAFYLAFSVVFPLFVLMGLGYFLRCVGIFEDGFLKRLNNLIFKAFLPMVLFLSIYNSDFEKDFSLALVGFGILGLLISFSVLVFIIPKVEKDSKKRGVMIQGIYRSNFILIGLPMAETLCGAESVAVTAVLISFAVPLINVFSVVALELYGESKSNYKHVLKSLVTNPLILAAITGMVVVFTGIRFPVLLSDVFSDIAGIATPLALISLGGSFYFSSIKRIWKQLVFCVVGRLVIQPFVFVSIAIFAGFRGIHLVSLFALFASPTAVSSYTMAQSMGGDAELAGQIVVMTSVGSLVSMFCWITAMTHYGFI